MKSKATGCGLISIVFSSIVLLCFGSTTTIIIIIIIIITITTTTTIIITTTTAVIVIVGNTGYMSNRGHSLGLVGNPSRDGVSLTILVWR